MSDSSFILMDRFLSHHCAPTSNNVAEDNRKRAYHLFILGDYASLWDAWKHLPSTTDHLIWLATRPGVLDEHNLMVFTRWLWQAVKPHVVDNFALAIAHRTFYVGWGSGPDNQPPSEHKHAFEAVWATYCKAQGVDMPPEQEVRFAALNFVASAGNLRLDPWQRTDLAVIMARYVNRCAYCLFQKQLGMDADLENVMEVKRRFYHACSQFLRQNTTPNFFTIPQA